MTKEHLDLADLKITGMTVLKSIYEQNLKIDYSQWKEHNSGYKFGLTPKIGISNSNKNSARLILSATLFSKDFETNGEPFYFSVEMAFFFIDTAEHDDGKNVVDHYLANMISMAFPYVRAYMQTVTALSGVSSVTIPPINVIKLIKKMTSKEQDESTNN